MARASVFSKGKKVDPPVQGSFDKAFSFLICCTLGGIRPVGLPLAYCPSLSSFFLSSLLISSLFHHSSLFYQFLLSLWISSASFRKNVLAHSPDKHIM